jgi:hypothetical protein
MGSRWSTTARRASSWRHGDAHKGGRILKRLIRDLRGTTIEADIAMLVVDLDVHAAGHGVDVRYGRVDGAYRRGGHAFPARKEC